jgi:transcriptional regulator with XRE-family HTH domain
MPLITTAFYLGQKIEAIRKAKGLTQFQLAESSECSRRTIILLEQGANVSIHTLFRVLATLGMTMDIMDKRADYRALKELQERSE